MAYHTPRQTIEETVSDLEFERLTAGWLGKVFGTADNSSNNIAGLCIVICLIFGGIMSIINISNRFEIWTYLSPIITGALGFLFGRGSKK